MTKKMSRNQKYAEQKKTKKKRFFYFSRGQNVYHCITVSGIIVFGIK